DGASCVIGMSKAEETPAPGYSKNNASLVPPAAVILEHWSLQRKLCHLSCITLLTSYEEANLPLRASPFSCLEVCLSYWAWYILDESAERELLARRGARKLIVVLTCMG